MKLFTKTHSILLFSILFGIIQSGNSQNSSSVTIEYNQKMVVDEKKIEHFPEQIKKTIRAKSKWNRTLLTHNKKGSYYMLKETLDDTSTQNNFDKTTFISGSTIYFNDFIDNKLYTQINMHEKSVLIEEPNHKYNWKLESDTKIFDSIKCHKATTINNQGKKVVAWYTNKFGINNGPSDYFGLPGLVIYLEGGLYIYKMTKVNFLDNEISLLKTNNKAIRISREEYNNLSKTSHRNIPSITN